MKKPERVEAGQWWGMPKAKALFRVDRVRHYLDEEWAVHVADESVSSCARMLSMDGYEYLGSGDHPEPSEWMIETLAEHFWTTKWVNRAWSSADIEERCGTMARVAMLLDQDDPVSHADRAVLSLYSILRSLGKW